MIKNENRRNIEKKKEERLDISISNQEILVTFKSFNSLPQQQKKFTNF